MRSFFSYHLFWCAFLYGPAVDVNAFRASSFTRSLGLLEAAATTGMNISHRGGGGGGRLFLAHRSCCNDRPSHFDSMAVNDRALSSTTQQTTRVNAEQAQEEDHLLEQNDTLTTSASWRRLETVADNFKKQNYGRVMFTIQELEKQDPALAAHLQQTAGVQFHVAKTSQELLQIYWKQPSIQLVLTLLVLALTFRCTLGPLGPSDLIVAGLTNAFWQVQEWLVHAELFHGSSNGKARWLFQSHDRHHHLPFFHVSTEPFLMCALWFGAVAGLTMAAVGLLGVPTDLAVTFLATYTASGVAYMSLHYLTHSKVPLKGWLQGVRERHMSHHLKEDHNLNMGPNIVDTILETELSLRETTTMKNQQVS